MGRLERFLLGVALGVAWVLLATWAANAQGTGGEYAIEIGLCVEGAEDCGSLITSPRFPTYETCMIAGAQALEFIRAERPHFILEFKCIIPGEAT